MAFVAQEYRARLSRSAEYRTEVDFGSGNRGQRSEVVADDVGRHGDVDACVIGIVGEHHEVVDQLTGVEAFDGLGGDGYLSGFADADIAVGRRHAFNHRLGGSHDLDGRTCHEVGVDVVAVFLGIGISDYERVIHVGIDNADKDATTPVEYHFGSVVVVVDIDIAVGVEHHVETYLSGAFAIGHVDNGIAVLNDEFAVLVSVGNLGVGADAEITGGGKAGDVAEAVA